MGSHGVRRAALQVVPISVVVRRDDVGVVASAQPHHHERRAVVRQQRDRVLVRSFVRVFAPAACPSVRRSRMFGGGQMQLTWIIVRVRDDGRVVHASAVAEDLSPGSVDGVGDVVDVAVRKVWAALAALAVPQAGDAGADEDCRVVRAWQLHRPEVGERRGRRRRRRRGRRDALARGVAAGFADDDAAGPAAALRLVRRALLTALRRGARAAGRRAEGGRAEAAGARRGPGSAVGLGLVADGEHPARVAVVAAQLRAEVCQQQQGSLRRRVGEWGGAGVGALWSKVLLRSCSRAVNARPFSS